MVLWVEDDGWIETAIDRARSRYMDENTQDGWNWGPWGTEIQQAVEKINDDSKPDIIQTPEQDLKDFIVRVCAD